MMTPYHSKYYHSFILFVFLWVSSNAILFAQTKGLIVKPATGVGAAVLDPNLDGYVSQTTVGFIANDVAESEIPYIRMDLPADDPLADTRTGPTDGFTDFVGNGNIYSAASRYDGTNLLFRFRLGGYASNAKGYSVLIDTDGKFGNTGPDADPQYSTTNPGFEVEVVLRTNFAVDVNNVNIASGIISTTPFTYDDHSQKAVAFTTNNGTADYFYDFYVPFSALTGLGLGITSSTPLRYVPNTVISPKSALVGNISDIGGVNDGTTGTTAGWTTIITGQTPVAADGTVQSEAPVVTSPIIDGATSVSGTSTEPNGTTITVYKNGVSIGTTTVTAGLWSLGPITALVSGQTINATAQASGELVSGYSNTVTVSCSYGSAPPTGFAISLSAGTKVVQVDNTSSAFQTGGTLNLYRAIAGGTTVIVNTGFTTLGTLPGTGQTSAQYCWRCTIGNDCGTSGAQNCTGATESGMYWADYKGPTSGCASTITAPFCVGGTSVNLGTGGSITVETAVGAGSTSVSGTLTIGTAGSGTGTYRIYLFSGTGTTTEVALGSVSVTIAALSTPVTWAVTGINGASVQAGKNIIAFAEKAVVSSCFNATPATRTITTLTASTAPVVTGPIATSATSISGTSVEANGTVINVYKNGVLLGQTTVTGGAWTLSGVSGLVVADAITATATASGEAVSATSNSVTVIATQTPVTPTITGTPYFEEGTSVSGGISAGTVNAGDILRVYIDGVQLLDASGNPIQITLTAGQTSWTLTGIANTELYPNGVLSAKVTRTGNSEGPISNTTTVQCTNPDLTAESLSATTPSVCNNTTASVQVANTDSGVIYTLYDAANTTALSSDRLGTGGTITFSTFSLSSDVSSFTLRAFKIPNTSCAANALKTLPTQITIYANPLDRTVSPASQTVIIGTSGSITVATSESGVNYQLWKDLATDILVSSQTGNGGTLTFSTGALGVTTIFYIKAILTHTAPDPDLFCELVMSQNATVNVNNDADGDGISGLTDLDDDNDGIPDIVEGKGVNPSLDTDGDGIPNFLDSDFAGFTDTNADGVDDRFDQDLDGIANHLDLDSDNDGIADVIEAGGIDVAGNGIVDFSEANANTADADNDGLIDNIDAGNADAAASSEITSGIYGGKYIVGGALDYDADGIPDFLDLDSDNDGIFDVLEAGGTDANNNGMIDFSGTFASNDTNGNGWINTKDGGNGGTSPITTTGAVGTAPTAYTGQNTDGDIVPDFRDLDSDNDGINDVIEAGLTDSDGNGLIGTGSGTTITGLNATTGVVTGATSTVLNTDGDGVANYRDLDSDNDGINDVRENGGTDANNDGLADGTDADADGILSSADGNLAGFGDTSDPASADADGDGVPNYRDLDADNDGINDVRENGTGALDTNNDGLINATDGQTDADNDGIFSGLDANVGFGDSSDPTPANADGDAVANYLDLDADNDGINDVRENGGTDANNDGLADGTDADADGILSSADGNAGFGDTSDPSPANADGDAVANYLDLDADNDGINDVRENGGTDADNNGVADGTDADNDGILSSADGNGAGFGDTSDPTPANADGDAVANYLDLDADNDGINDVRENGGTDANNDGLADGTDADNDGILSSADGNAGFGDTSDPSPANADGDAVANYLDLDADNDGINDVRENGNAALDTNNDGKIDALDTGQTDADNDGIFSGLDANVGFGDTSDPSPANADGDAVANYLDLDADNDGINDVRENGNATLDTNNDGVINALDGQTDADNDGIFSGLDTNVGFGDTSDPSPANVDGDAVANYLDLDADNDGINDVIEGGNAALDTNSDGLIDGPDADNDGIQDGTDGNDSGFGEGIAGDATPPLNSDGDTAPNYLDLDSDNDNINDVIENQDTNGNGIIDGGETNFDTNNDGLVDSGDIDGDGIQNVADTNDSGFGENDFTSTTTDTDGGASPNYIDLNSDGDAINDIDEICTPTPSAGCSTLDVDDDGDVDGSSDADGDGILTAADGNDSGFGEGTGPLPVTFVTFEGKLINNQVQFTWKTASETNNSHFIIERSTDTYTWATVAKVEAKGESQGLTSYQGFDENPQVGTNYYRLWQVDKDGKKEVFPRLIDITYQFIATTSVYPNPTIDKLNVKLKSNINEPVQIRIINISGRVLQTIRFQKTNLEEEAILSVKDLPSGTYFLEVFYYKGRETLKFVK